MRGRFLLDDAQATVYDRGHAGKAKIARLIGELDPEVSSIRNVFANLTPLSRFMLEYLVGCPGPADNTKMPTGIARGDGFSRTARHIIESVIKALLRYVRHDMTKEEVDAALIKLAATNSEDLDWRNSIADLSKLLDLDSGLPARKQLALEFGYKGPLDGSAKMNMWLHDQVLREIASRGIKLPT